MKTEINFDGYGNFFVSKLDLNLREKLVLHLAHSFVWYWNLDTWEIGSEYL